MFCLVCLCLCITNFKPPLDWYSSYYRLGTERLHRAHSNVSSTSQAKITHSTTKKTQKIQYEKQLTHKRPATPDETETKRPMSSTHPTQRELGLCFGCVGLSGRGASSCEVCECVARRDECVRSRQWSRYVWRGTRSLCVSLSLSLWLTRAPVAVRPCDE